MSYQNILFALIALEAVFFIIFLILIVFSFTKKARVEKNNVAINFSEKLWKNIEREIQSEIKRTTSETNKKVLEEIIPFYKKQISVLSEKLNKIFSSIEESARKEILNIEKTGIYTRNSMLEDTKRTTKEISRDLEKKIGWIYEAAAASIAQKIIQTEEYIENYKKSRIEEIDSKTHQLIEEVVKKYIGNSLKKPIQEKLLLKAIEEAKKEII